MGARLVKEEREKRLLLVGMVLVEGKEYGGIGTDAKEWHWHPCPLQFRKLGHLNKYLVWQEMPVKSSSLCSLPRYRPGSQFFFLSKIVSIKEQEMWLWHFVLKCQLSLLIIIWLLFQNLLWSQSLRVAADSWKCWHRLSPPGMFSELPALSQARNAEKGPFLWFLCISHFLSSTVFILAVLFFPF